MSKDQIAARRAWRKARESYRKATAGERRKTYAAFRKSADAVLMADANARKARQMKKVAA